MLTPSSLQLMLVLLQIEKELKSSVEFNASLGIAEPPVLPMEWCTRASGGESDHVIVIYDLDRLVKEILPRFAFAPITPASFVRKLSRWGFRQVSTEYGSVRKTYSNRPQTSRMFECVHFRRGNFALISRMRSDTAEKRRYEESLAAAAGNADMQISNGKSPAPSGPTRTRKRRSKVSAEEKRHRADLGEDRKLCQGEAPAQYSGDSNVRSVISLPRSMNQYQSQLDPTQMIMAHARSMLSSAAREASAGPDIQISTVAQQFLYDRMQSQAIMSAGHAALGHVFPALRRNEHYISRISDPSQLEILGSLFNSAPQRPLTLPQVVPFQQPARAASAFVSSPDIWPQATGSSDLNIQLLMQLLQSAQQPQQRP
jgi:HSF-type DNA-binding